MPKLTKEQFIERARAVHGDKYDYSKVEYVNTSTKVCIICPEHGEFWQTPSGHLSKRGCSKCRNLRLTYDVCYQEAKKYSTKGEFAKNAPTAYNKARKQEWLKDYDWFVEGCTPAGFWTYEKCLAIAKKYTRKIDFLNNAPQAYSAAVRHNWLKDYDWFIERFKWTCESCYEVAKQFQTKREFENGKCGAYIAARKHGWLKDYTWMIEARTNVIKDPVDTVYSYYFEKYNAIYVGRTINPKSRDRAHIFNIENDAVAKFAQENRCAVPPMTILEDNLTLVQGQDREDYWVNYYKDKGYFILNKAKTGIGVSSLGAIGQGKWTKKTCYEAARQYHCKNDFKKFEVGAYTRALRKGWLKDYTWFSRPEPIRKWTVEACYNVASEFEKRIDFENAYPGAYAAAKKHGWLGNYTWLVTYETPKVWTYEECFELAKKFKTRSEFMYAKGCGKAYITARKNGWIKDYTWFIEKQKPNGYWTYERCYQAAQQFMNRSEFEYAKGMSRAYKTAVKNGWIKDYTWFIGKQKPSGYWTHDRCMDESHKYKTRSEFKKGNQSAYVITNKNGWMDEFFPKK